MRPTDAGAFAERIYTALDPYTYDEANNDWALLCFLGALGTMFQEVEDYASDTPDRAGWGVLLDVDDIPAKGLPWLGQFVGTSVNPALPEADQRQQLKDANSQKRGSLAAFQAAPLPWLTGTKRVLVRERDAAVVPGNPAYGLTVYTIASETTNTAAVLAALAAIKPAGIILNYAAVSGQDWATLAANYASWNAVKAHYSTWDGVKSDTTGI